MKRQRANTRTTRAKLRQTQTEETTIPENQCGGEGYYINGHKGAHWILPGSQGASNVFCCAALGDAVSGTFYTDMTGAFPVMSLEGKQYYFVAYYYDTSAIFAIPFTYLGDETIITAFTEVFEELVEKGYTPTFNVTDNQATTPIKAFLKNNN